MKYSIKKICEIINGVFLQLHENDTVEHLLLDSRKVYFPDYSLFFALNGPRRNGHQFIPELYKKGVRNFIVTEKIQTEFFPEGNFILVPDVLLALQQLAGYHRSQFKIPVIGITGSNGKTIVKEWLYQLLNENYNIVRSPKSYNSQIGVPLSVWQMNETHTLAIFEAGISTTQEMEKLERIIQPTIGVLTNIGESHSEGFKDRDEKFSEKLKLFLHCQSIIYCKDVLEHFSKNKSWAKKNNKRVVDIFSWSFYTKDSQLFIKEIEKNVTETRITGIYREKEITITIPFIDDASVENAITCWSVMLVLHPDSGLITARMKRLMPVNMRLELKKGINHCSVINDSYSADLSSFNIALNFLEQQAPGSKKTVILSDFLQSGMNAVELYKTIGSYLIQHSINRVIGIGSAISIHLPSFLGQQNIQQEYFPTTAEFIQHFRFSQFKEETILVKGARMFEFENIVSMLEQKVHQTVLEINLNALVHNLKQYQKKLKPTTKIMAMVKAFSYGSGGAEIAGILQFHNVDYLGVAYVDEGIELRKSGISLPVMVMNPERNSFELLVQFGLEPEIYSFDELKEFDQYLKNEKIQQYPVHIEIETGMNRLGFAREDIPKLGEYLYKSGAFKVQSVFSHLVASEDQEEDKFTAEQFKEFLEASSTLKDSLGYAFIMHISNSAAIIRHPEMQMDMVRLGIGLYGVNSTATDELDLQTVATLKSTVAQVKYVKAGESVSYNRKGVVKRNSVIATVRIGYADGYIRRLGNGIGKMVVKNKLAPVVGHVCMDMTMIDVTDIAGVKEGDEVIIIGKELPVQKIAAWVGTIPYEIMTGISQRVKRVYYEE